MFRLEFFRRSFFMVVFMTFLSAQSDPVDRHSLLPSRDGHPSEALSGVSFKRGIRRFFPGPHSLIALSVLLLGGLFLVQAFWTETFISYDVALVGSPEDDARHDPSEFPDRKDGTTINHRQFPSPCLFGGNFGGWQGEVHGPGLVLPPRQPANRALTRGAILLSGDVRPTYGVIRPHLLFCRLQN